ncbi:MAG: hypothetical protein BroJett024_04240 [Alphaproteobacteria bacterium]|nr:MAG: hypothetical protein BroJett024_04240 [Alphaproteobacteria bacterium]
MALKELVRIAARQRALVPLVARWAARQVRPFGNRDGDARTTVLALNAPRYRADLRMLDAHPDIRIVTLPEAVQDKINALFLARIHPLIARSATAYFDETNSAILETRLQLRAYLRAFLPTFCRLAGIDAMTTCTFYYVRDREWEAAAQEVGIPFIVGHKENMKDEVIIPEMIRQYRERSYKFHGTQLAVYNAGERRCLVDGAVARPETIVLTGCPRLDPLLHKRAAGEFAPPRKLVTLFSFRHLVGGMRLTEARGGFVSARNHGLVAYFDKTHAAFARAAQRNPDWEFVIKPKWAERWSEEIEDAIVRELGVGSAAIPNLSISIERPAQQLIEESAVIAGVNSTSLIEARIAGRPVVIPVFEEAAGIHQDRIYFRKYFGTEFLVGETPEHFITQIEAAMRAERSLVPGDGTALIEEFFGFADGRATERLAAVFSAAVAGRAA